MLGVLKSSSSTGLAHQESTAAQLEQVDKGNGELGLE